MTGGFRPPRSPLKLDFTGTEYEGLEVTVRPMPMSVMLDITTAGLSADAFRHVTATFAYALEAWNVEDEDGEPVPADLDGLMSQDGQFVTAVLRARADTLTRGAGL